MRFVFSDEPLKIHRILVQIIAITRAKTTRAVNLRAEPSTQLLTGINKLTEVVVLINWFLWDPFRLICSEDLNQLKIQYPLECIVSNM